MIQAFHFNSLNTHDYQVSITPISWPSQGNHIYSDVYPDQEDQDEILELSALKQQVWKILQ